MIDSRIQITDEQINRLKRIGHLHFPAEGGGYITIEYDDE